MLSFGNATCAAQISAQPKSSFPFYEKLSTYVSLRVSGMKPLSEVAPGLLVIQILIQAVCAVTPKIFHASDFIFGVHNMIRLDIKVEQRAFFSSFLN